MWRRCVPASAGARSGSAPSGRPVLGPQLAELALERGDLIDQGGHVTLRRQPPEAEPGVERLVGLARQAALELEAERGHVHERVALHPRLGGGGQRPLDEVEGHAPQRSAHPIAFSRPAHSCSRRTNFWILPVDVRGSSPNSTAPGHLNFARCSRQNSSSSSSPASSPDLSSTNAFGRSPHFSSGIATTATSETAGCRTIACSTSMLEMFSPPEMMMSLERSRSST